MRKKWGNAEYVTKLESDDEQGWIAVRLDATTADGTRLAARVVFWDASGKFSFEMSSQELPLVVVEELISEAKATIVTK